MMAHSHCKRQGLALTFVAINLSGIVRFVIPACFWRESRSVQSVAACTLREVLFFRDWRKLNAPLSDTLLTEKEPILNSSKITHSL
jgi:hypothetical protein